jgi:iron complex outermembrane receptor protein
MILMGVLGARAEGQEAATVPAASAPAAGGSEGAAASAPKLSVNPFDGQAGNGVYGMSLEELLNVEVRSPAGLTAMDARRVPVDMTVLEARDIQQSGARDINSLLEIYVPNAQFILHHSNTLHMGFRGIISDREDKYLYQVNGVTMNSRMLNGSDNERGLPLMGDINTVNVVRGPASSTHGAGAIIGVIDVETHTGLTFQGLDLRVNEGFVDEYTTGEIRYGKKFSETSGLFLYYGTADVQGAASDYFIGKSYAAKNGLPANIAGQPYEGPMANLGGTGLEAPVQKLHLSYVNGPWEVWGRYVTDGGESRPNREIYTNNKPADVPLDVWTHGRDEENQQGTTTVRFKTDLSPTWNLELLQSYDMFAFRDQRAGFKFTSPVRHGYEQQLFSRAIATWTPSKAQSLAFGAEYSHMWFYDPAQSDALDKAPVVTDRAWETNTISLLAEDQWKINEQWTSILSFRTDKSTFSEWLMSPRGALVFMPTDRDTFKAMAGQSVRRGDDEELWGQWERSNTIPSPETLRTYEVSYDRKMTEQLQLSLNAFYEDYAGIGWIASQYADGSLGKFQIAGGEMGLTYKSDNTRIVLSEGVSTLVHASLPAGLAAAGQGVTAAPYGFGNDLAEWAPSITKLSLIQDLTKDVTANVSAVYYSGFPGARDYARYASTLASPPSAVPLSDAGYTVPYGPNLYINAGLEYRPNKQLTIRLDGYNLAGLISEKLSKRNYYFRTSEYSEEPAAVRLSVIYRF